MNNNKNRLRDRAKSNAELRKMEPRDNADIGMEHGQILGLHPSKSEKQRPLRKSEK